MELQSLMIDYFLKEQAKLARQQAAHLLYTTSSLDRSIAKSMIQSRYDIKQQRNVAHVIEYLSPILRYRSSDSIVTRSTSTSNYAHSELRGRRSPAHAHDHMLLQAFQSKGKLSSYLNLVCLRGWANDKAKKRSPDERQPSRTTIPTPSSNTILKPH